MNLNDLTGKTAIVTGAAQGLGYGMAEGLMEAGAKVCIMDVNPKALEVAEEFNKKGFECVAVISNLAKDESREDSFNEAVEKLGNHLDIIVNAAGVQRRYKSEEFPLDEWDFVIDINLRSVFALCQLAGRQFIKQNSGGKIINVASMLSYFGGYTVPAYAASKGGVAQLTKALCN
ncbi:SDR family NAD(P)-dependent oxidoreductase, partial [Anaerococcus obesiensis]|uniref:SDR family NAD(P)-dependent oxidoreductase n=2 Tax=Anaerococcus TaxID=165779 RepID=UPI003995B7C1